MNLAIRAQEAYRRLHNKETVEDSLAYIASEEIAAARVKLEKELTENPLENADKSVRANEIIEGGKGELIDPEEHEMHGLSGDYVTDEAKFFVFQDGSILKEDENGSFSPVLFDHEIENQFEYDEGNVDEYRPGGYMPLDFER